MAYGDIPVYLFTGFLESGKTTFIQNTLEDPQFNRGENILVLMCEEGEVEYDPSSLPHKENVFFQVINKESDLTTANLMSYQRKYRARHIMIEYNGMWQLQSLFMNIPDQWYIYREMCFVDSTTFATYNANMRSLVVDKFQTAEMIVFNKAKENVDKDFLHKTVRAITRTAQIAIVFENGKVFYDETVDPLPFETDGKIVTVEDKDYALFYRDIFEEPDKYAGKEVRFKGMVFNEKRAAQQIFLIGRHIMVCCQNDITYRGFVCKYSQLPAFKTNDWAYVKATVSVEQNRMYDGKAPY